MKSEECFLLDIFIEKDDLIFHLIRKDAVRFFLKKRYYPKIHIKGKRINLPYKTTLKVKKDIFEKKEVEVWEVEVPISKWENFKRKLLFKEDIEVYNLDLAPQVQFYFENSIFPTSKVEVFYDGDRLIKINPRDDPFSINYSIPPLNIFGVKYCEGEGIEVSYRDRIFHFEEINEELINFFKKVIIEERPDLIVSVRGDDIIFPKIYKACRDFRKIFTFRGGFSFFSYGKVVYKAQVTYISRIIHIDLANSFFGKHTGLEGIFEVARLTSFPLQEASRISPGSSISLMELKTAFKRGYLIPSTKAYPENFKKASYLLEIDKGGVFFLPPVGIVENVAELDFFSMYPSIIAKYNISIDTFKCDCCRELASKIKIPFTDYYFCRKNKGIIPETIEPLLEKRKKYKEILKKEYSEDIDLRQSAIKWMLVTCFGYLGYKNAKFGCVEAHEATTAMGRFLLLKAKEIAEEKGFEIVYAITDAIYVRKDTATEKDYKLLAEEITKKTGFKINLEGIFKFIKFLPAVCSSTKPVMNRFIGIYKNGEVKIRGLMINRRDTPEFIKKFQKEIIENIFDKEKCIEIFEKYEQILKDCKVNIKELAIKKKVTKKPSDYKVKTPTSIIASKIENINPGENILYVVVDEKNKISEERIKSIYSAESYDFNYYLKLLKKAFNEVNLMI